MKKISVGLLLLAFLVTAVGQPTAAFAKRGGDDNRSDHSGSSHDDYDDDEDEDEYEDEDDSDDDNNDDDDNSNDDDSNESLEVEADVFTDMTIVKVELENGKKTVFRTNADTREEVIDVVADKFNLTEDEVDDVLDFQIENRATRAKERAKLTGVNNNPVEVCEDSSDELEVEADVFTDTTVVKVKEGTTTTVYESDATTSAAIVDEVADKFDLGESDVEDVIDFEKEDRASRTSDFTVDRNTDDCDDVDNDSSNDDNRDAQLRARVAELQKLIETLIRLLNARLGSGN